ncbi:NAD(P)H-binding protein, partial [Burkholderia cenocepacia]|nr:NAD(P)H-binding protein [Burkholderia cenocepacia]
MAKHPVVVYGASGYTGMLIMDWLIDQNIPFTAVARNAARAKEMMAQRVVRLESAQYEIIEAEHDVDALVKAFRGAKVVCNTVGPFSSFGLVGVEAALKAGCHHLDTTGEQSYIRAVRDEFGEQYRQAGLLASSSNAYMYTFAEIAAELALETPGIDALETATLTRGPRG